MDNKIPIVVVIYYGPKVLITPLIYFIVDSTESFDIFHDVFHPTSICHRTGKVSSKDESGVRNFPISVLCGWTSDTWDGLGTDTGNYNVRVVSQTTNYLRVVYFVLCLFPFLSACWVPSWLRWPLGLVSEGTEGSVRDVTVINAG